MAFSEKTRPACLIIHGYGGSPCEMEGIARALKEEGFCVNVSCLPGHGEDKTAFASFRFGDWLAHVGKELTALLAKHEKVCVVGFSMGGALALNLAARFPVAGVAALSAPLYVLHVFPWPWWNAVFYASSGLARLKKIFGSKAEEDAGERRPSRLAAPWKGYDGPFDLAQMYSCRQGCAATRKLLPDITAPLLVMHDPKDRIVYAGNACEIARRVSSRKTKIVFTRIQETTTRHHMIVTHRETEAFVAENVSRFCRSACMKTS